MELREKWVSFYDVGKLSQKNRKGELTFETQCICKPTVCFMQRDDCSLDGEFSINQTYTQS